MRPQQQPLQWLPKLKKPKDQLAPHDTLRSRRRSVASEAGLAVRFLAFFQCPGISMEQQPFSAMRNAFWDELVIMPDPISTYRVNSTLKMGCFASKLRTSRHSAPAWLGDADDFERSRLCSKCRDP
jgi:hypothetical protein